MAFKRVCDNCGGEIDLSGTGMAFRVQPGVFDAEGGFVNNTGQVFEVDSPDCAAAVVQSVVDVQPAPGEAPPGPGSGVPQPDDGDPVDPDEVVSAPTPA